MLSSPFKTALLLWCVAEVLVFALAVHFVGLGWTMLAEVATTALGFFLLKRTGAAAMLKLRAAFQGRLAPGRGTGNADDADVVDGALSVLGALALVLPGFVSDLFGLALLVRAVRTRLAAALGGGRFKGWGGPGGGIRFPVRRGRPGCVPSRSSSGVSLWRPAGHASRTGTRACRQMVAAGSRSRAPQQLLPPHDPGMTHG